MEEFSGKRKVIQYLLACSQDIPQKTENGQEKVPSHVVAARKSLVELRKTDARIIDEVIRSMERQREFLKSLTKEPTD